MACITKKKGRLAIDFYDQHGRSYEPKSEASKRKIDLGPTAMAKLKKWKLACPPNELVLIFPNAAGKPIDFIGATVRSRTADILITRMSQTNSYI